MITYGSLDDLGHPSVFECIND